MHFEWDERKRLKNIKDHGVDFRLAAGIFLSPVIENYDNRNDYGETRIQAIGIVKDTCLMVVYTWRNNNRRIISSWRIGENGRRKYKALLARTN